MTNRASHGKIHHAIKFGKASISIRAMASMANCECHNQRGFPASYYDTGNHGISWDNHGYNKPSST